MEPTDYGYFECLCDAFERQPASGSDECDWDEMPPEYIRRMTRIIAEKAITLLSNKLVFAKESGRSYTTSKCRRR